jgi:transcriptional regulator with XRE-family HTH domain
MKQLGKRLRELRQQRGLSQQDLARIAKLHFMQVGKYERGEVLPAAESLLALARALSVTADYLLTGQNEPERNTDTFRFPLLYEKVRQLDQELEKPDLNAILEFLDAFLAKKRLKRLIA